MDSPFPPEVRLQKPADCGVMRKSRLSSRWRVGIVSLGCAKNTVDAETALAELLQDGFELAVDPADADLALVNTCAFIAPARAESESTLAELLRPRRGRRRPAVVAIGCYAQRDARALRRRFPGLAAVWGFSAYGRLPALCRALLGGRPDEAVPAVDGDAWRGRVYAGPRLLSTPGSFAWLRLSDGCDNGCAYCAIPLIRGRYRERPAGEIVDEARLLARGGAGELILVAQDATRYGSEAGGLAGLLERLLASVPVRTRLRVLYAHPARLDQATMALLAREPRLCGYLDLPMQHASDRVLGAMGRGYGRARIEEILDFFAKVPDFTLRTTLLAGFPGESEKDFAEALALASDPRIRWLGAFAWSPEAGTRAAELPGALPARERERRRDALLAARQPVTFAWLDGRAAAGRRGHTETVRLDAYDGESGEWIGRTRREAPDGDGVIRIPSGRGTRRWNAGRSVEVRVQARRGYDLSAR